MSIDLSTLGLDPTGSTDATAALNAALATGQDCLNGPVGTFKVTNKLTMPVAGQRFWWSSPWRSQLIVDSASFNMSAMGVIEAAAGVQPGPDVRNLGIVCRQPDTTNPALLHPYPPCINLQDSPRSVIENVQLVAGTTGIAFRGNCGGGYVRQLQSACLSSNIFIENAQDTMRISDAHIWPFGLTANQEVIFFGSTIGIFSLRCDGLFMRDCLTICGTGLQTQPGAGGKTWANITGCGFDSFNGINNLGCNDINISGGYFTPGIGNAIGIKHVGPGHINVSGSSFGGGQTGLVYPMIETGDVNAIMNINGCSFESLGSDRCHVTLIAGEVNAIGNQHNRTAGTYGNQTYCCYAANNARLTAIGNRQNPITSGQAAFLYLEGGDNHQIHDNTAMGWIYFGNGYTTPGANTRKSNNVGIGA